MEQDMLIHPGEVLRDDFMEPHGLNANRLANALNFAPNRITAIIQGERGITAETAILFAHAFETTPQFWLNLQSRYDLDRGQDQVSPERIAAADALAQQLRSA